MEIIVIRDRICYREIAYAGQAARQKRQKPFHIPPLLHSEGKGKRGTEKSAPEKAFLGAYAIRLRVQAVAGSFNKIERRNRLY
jgi:hypothetical protein